MANVVYNKFKSDLLAGSIDFDANTFKVMLVTSAYVADPDHDYRSSITNEVVGTGYTAGGAALGTVTVTQDNTANRAKISISGNVTTWPTATITARGAVIYKSTGNAATDVNVGYVDFGADKTSTAGDFAINWDATNGILYL